MSKIPDELPFSEGSLFLGALSDKKKPKLLRDGLPEGILMELNLGPFEGGIRVVDRMFAPLFMSDARLKCTLGGHRVTQFHLGDSLHVMSDGPRKKEDEKPTGYVITFLPIEGFSRFVGRIAIGNRTDPKGKLKEIGRGFDRMIFLEALEGFEAAKLNLEVRALYA
jgi:hypothetical protein